MIRPITLSKGLGVLVVAAGLAACSSTPEQRAIEGGAIGAGVGAIGSGITGGSVLGGAIIGGAAGAAVGATTTEDQIDLDK